MNATLELCTQFWTQVSLKDKEHDFESLYRLSLDIAKWSKDTDKCYKKIRKAQPEYVAIIVLYEKFLRDILSYENDAQREQNEINLAT